MVAMGNSCYFSSNFDVVFFVVVEWIVLSTFGSMSTGYLYLLRNTAHFCLLKFERFFKFFVFVMKYCRPILQKTCCQSDIC